MSTELVQAAIGYSTLGLSVFPVRPHDKLLLQRVGMAGAVADMTTRTGKWIAAHWQTATVELWWRRWPSANIGCTPGRCSPRLLVVNIDGPDGASEAERLGLLPAPGPAVVTSRGLHVYYRHPGGTVGNLTLAPGVDVRADAGYVLLPPSIHPNGSTYRWERRYAPLPALPSAALHAIEAAA